MKYSLSQIDCTEEENMKFASLLLYFILTTLIHAAVYVLFSLFLEEIFTVLSMLIVAYKKFHVFNIFIFLQMAHIPGALFFDVDGISDRNSSVRLL